MKITASKIYLFVTSALAVSPLGVQAEEHDELGLIEVVANENVTGQKTVTRQEIKRTPKGNGTINSLLATTPAVNFSNANGQSVQGGEIEPELISFHGEPYYNNLFVIDGMSNNDIMNPGSSNGGYHKYSAGSFESPTAMYLAPGSPESFHVNSSLVRTLKVYDANVPAKYTNFTGGVIDAELLDADTSRRRGRIGYRTTRDSWTKFHLTPQQAEDFAENDATANMQPEFVKHSYNLVVNQPVGEKSALLFSYNRTQSKMPENHKILNVREKEKRLAETYMLKGTHFLNDNHKLSATLMYSPHKNVYFADNVKNGRYQSEGGGWRANLKSDRVFDWGRMTTTFDYTYQRNRIKYDAGSSQYWWVGGIAGSPIDWCSQYISSTNKTCQYGKIGGLGELSSTTKTYTLKQDYELEPIETGYGTHGLDFGWNISLARAHAQRPQDLHYYTTGVSNAILMRAGRLRTGETCVQPCIPNEQFIMQDTLYGAYNAKVNVDNYAVYLQDKFDWGRFRLIPGVNTSYDSFLKNWNIAPRFTFKFDVLGDNTLNITGGANRYYAGNMLAYALRSKVPVTQIGKRTSADQGFTYEPSENPQIWENARNLDTPYSDEGNIGFNYQIANHLLDVQFVHRSGKKHFTTAKNESGEKTVTNGGYTQSNAVTLSWRNLKSYEFGPLAVSYQIGANYQHNKNSVKGNYDASMLQEVNTAIEYRHMYEGELYESQTDLPPFDFNTPWSGFLQVNTDLPGYGFSWTHRLSYRSGYRHYNRKSVMRCSQSSSPGACGDYDGRVWDYYKKAFKRTFVLDWNFIWQIPLDEKSNIELTLDVMNVLNQKVATTNILSNYVAGTETQSTYGYKSGRQFWLGLAYNW